MSKPVEEFYNEWITNRFGLNDKGEVHRGALSSNTQNKLMQAYADKVKLEHTIEALGNVKTDWFHTSDIYDAIDLETEKYQKQLEQLKAK